MTIDQNLFRIVNTVMTNAACEGFPDSPMRPAIEVAAWICHGDDELGTLLDERGPGLIPEVAECINRIRLHDWLYERGA